MPAFSTRSFQSDIKALENFHRFPEGKNEYNSPVTILSPEDFIEKYPDLFDDKTDPSRLPKTAEGIASLVASSALGAKKSITRDKIASKGLKAFTEDDPELRDLFNPDDYVSLEKDPESGEEVKLYLQDPTQFEKFVKNMGLFVTKYVDHLVGERLDQMKYDVDSDMQNKLDQLESNLSVQFEDYIGKEAPRLMQRTSQEENVKKIFNHYGNQILSNNSYKNEVFTHLSGIDAEAVKKLYSSWESKTLAKFNQWQLVKPDGTLTPELVKAFVDSSLVEMLGEQGKFLLEPLPTVDLTIKIPEYQPNNTEPPVETPPAQQPIAPQQVIQQPENVIMGQIPAQANQPQYQPPRTVGNLPPANSDGANPMRDKLLSVIQNGKIS